MDGQHRLAGIKRAIRGRMTDSEDEVSVIFLGHKNTTDGLEATRRLFTTLNKTANPIALRAQGRGEGVPTTATLRVIYPATNPGPGRATQQVACWFS